jgi:hypothetical protein
MNLAFNLLLRHNDPGCAGVDIAGVVRTFSTLKIFLTLLFLYQFICCGSSGPGGCILNQFDKICKQKRKKGICAMPIP